MVRSTLSLSDGAASASAPPPKCATSACVLARLLIVCILISRERLSFPKAHRHRVVADFNIANVFSVRARMPCSCRHCLKRSKRGEVLTTTLIRAMHSIEGRTDGRRRLGLGLPFLWCEQKDLGGFQSGGSGGGGGGDLPLSLPRVDRPIERPR